MPERIKIKTVLKNGRVIFPVYDESKRDLKYKTICPECNSEIFQKMASIKANRCCSKCGPKKMSTHGETNSLTYTSWQAMKARCTRVNLECFNNYGGRGIGFCEEWAIFDNFLRDMGERPHGTTLDRVDNNGDYCRENCRWATRSEQNKNRRYKMIRSNSGYKGVSSSSKNRYAACIRVCGITYHIGSFKTAKEAAYAYETVHYEWFGVNSVNRGLLK